jgi:hypothetical protein
MEPFVTEKRSWDRKDVAALLASKSALVELDADTALAVVRLMSLHRFKAGDVIIQEGASNTSFLVLVLRGEVVVENEGLSRAVAQFSPYQSWLSLLGLEAFLAAPHRRARSRLVAHARATAFRWPATAGQSGAPARRRCRSGRAWPGSAGRPPA